MRTDAEIESLVRGFEDGTLPKSQWTHGAHLAVALWYLRRHPRGEAEEKVREGIRAYNLRQGNTRGYHETITRAWVAVVACFLAEHDRGQTLAELAGALVGECGEPGYLFRFYTRGVLWSDEARRAWVPPDVRPIG